MLRNITEQEWILEYVKGKENPFPVVLGTRGTWSANKKPMIILVGFTPIDIEILAELHGVSHHPVREMKYKGIQYYAVNIINKKQVKKIIQDWQHTENLQQLL